LGSRRPLAFGLVGAGGIAQSYLEVFAGCEHARITAVADTRPERAGAMAEQLDCAAFDSYQALAAAARCDAVLVCTPPSTHPEISLHLVERGVAVLCEKPLAIDSESARRLVAAAERVGVPLTMAAKFRYVDDIVRAKTILSSGTVGEPILFGNIFASRVPMAHRWNSDPAVSGGGVLIDNGTHSVDIVRYLVGPITEVLAVEGKRIQELPVEDTAQVFVLTAGGVTGNIDLSWSISKEADSYVDIYGSEGVISVGWRQSRYRKASNREWVAFGHGYDKIVCMRRQVENFCGAVRGEEELRITGADAIASVSVIEAAYESLGRSHWVAVVGAPGDGRAGARVA
jgi:predicted dehydrogenase